MEVERRLNMPQRWEELFECMNYSCYYPVLEVQQFEHFKGIFRLLGWLFSMEKLRVDCGYTHTYFFSRTVLLVWLRIYG